MELSRSLCVTWLSSEDTSSQVGGEGAKGGVDITGKVYRFKEESLVWVEFLEPMPTARYSLSAATTQSVIIASGRITGVVGVCLTAEVYSTETFQWLQVFCHHC